MSITDHSSHEVYTNLYSNFDKPRRKAHISGHVYAAGWAMQHYPLETFASFSLINHTWQVSILYLSLNMLLVWSYLIKFSKIYPALIGRRQYLMRAVSKRSRDACAPAIHMHIYLLLKFELNMSSNAGHLIKLLSC